MSVVLVRKQSSYIQPWLEEGKALVCRAVPNLQSLLATMAEQIFVQNLLTTLSTQTVTYGDDYQQPPENSLKKVPVLPVRKISFQISYVVKCKNPRSNFPLLQVDKRLQSLWIQLQ